jgi:hypothetical protein
MPDQPWTAWWEIDDADLTAPRTAPHATSAQTSGDAATHPTSVSAGDVLAAETPGSGEQAPRGATDEGLYPEDVSPLQTAFPHVDTIMRGGIQRVGAPPPGDASVIEDDPGLAGEPPFGAPLRPLDNWALAETAATGAVDIVGVGVETVQGQFSVEGFARRSGDLVFSGVTFPDPVDAPPAPGAIELTVDEAINVAGDGVRVADRGGFTADRQGFTLITTAQGPGMVRAHGHYVVEI